MFNNLTEALSFIDEQSIEQVDLKFCDLWGRWHHVTVSVTGFDQELMEQGIGFDASSVGFKSISSGDMVMVPDLATGFVDPFWDLPTLSFICTILEADTRRLFPYDPRSIARRAEDFMRSEDIADTALWGPEFEFYVFNGISYENGMNVAAYRVESDEGDWSNKVLGSGYAMPVHGGYHAIPPRDHLHNLRSRICARLDEAGFPVKYHHHEVGGPGQCEIETPLISGFRAADATMMAKYITRLTAQEEGLTATFMPKPLHGEAGSGLHFHQRLEKDGVNIFYDADGYGCISETARHFIGGLLHHGGAVLAFTNPSTNSYRRLIPGFEAPVSAIFSAGNRSAAVRIPRYANTPDSARIEFRPPDASCNPYLAITAQLMAGLDGIRRRLDPTELGFGPISEDIFSWPEEKRATIKSLPNSLGAAMDALENDHEFLLAGGVFNEDLITRWITAKRQEERSVCNRPHPFEIELYYDL
ncbi:MAG: type I glutamate--ammonia ligase [Thermoanaerobaculales bacterium]|nr:type I glutamate--ammonia ligase [Thermoanaerobaculales bacterium]